MIKQQPIKMVGYGTFGGLPIGTLFTPTDEKNKLVKIYTKVSLTAGTERTTWNTITIPKNKPVYILRLPIF